MSEKFTALYTIITGMFPAQTFPLPHRFIRLVLLMTFAILAATPTSFAQEDATMPDEAHLEHIAEAGRLAGEIQACELDWEEFYFRLHAVGAPPRRQRGA